MHPVLTVNFIFMRFKGKKRILAIIIVVIVSLSMITFYVLPYLRF